MDNGVYDDLLERTNRTVWEAEHAYSRAVEVCEEIGAGDPGQVRRAWRERRELRLALSVAQRARTDIVLSRSATLVARADDLLALSRRVRAEVSPRDVAARRRPLPLRFRPKPRADQS